MNIVCYTKPTPKLPEGIPCSICGRKTLPGQYVFHHAKKNMGHFILHVECVRKMLNDFPVTADGTLNGEINFIKETIKENGLMGVLNNE